MVLNTQVLKEKQIRRPLGWLLGFAILERLLLWVAYQPVPYSDTNSYRRLAEAILKGWSAYDGTRTPGYPAFLALLGSDRRVFLGQMALGVGIVLSLFFLAWWLSGDVRVAFLAGIAHLLNLGQLFFEANLLTETLSTFWMMLALVGAVYGMVFPSQWANSWGRAFLAAGVGVATGIALLTRPVFVYLPPLIFLFIFIGWSGKEKTEVVTKKVKELWQLARRTWLYLVAFSLPVIILVGAWVGFIHKNFGSWGLSTMTGYHLVQHTGVFFEYVPDKYAAIRDTYLKYRDERIAKYGTQANTIWDAIPEMQQASGMGFYELSDTLAKISIQLILEHPLLYARNVVEGWGMFWFAPVYWSPGSIRWQSMLPLFRALIMMERAGLFACNMVFIFTILLVVVWRPVRRLWQVNLPWVFLLANIWAASVVQTLLDHGDNPRFLIPLQSLVVLWVIWVVWKILEGRIARVGRV
jgi:hypothetical protein